MEVSAALKATPSITPTYWRRR